MHVLWSCIQWAIPDKLLKKQYKLYLYFDLKFESRVEFLFLKIVIDIYAYTNATLLFKKFIVNLE